MARHGGAVLIQRRVSAGAVPGILATLVLLVACSESRLPLPPIEPSRQVDLARWVLEHGLPPEDYVVSKFADHDVVFLGEYHRILHDVVLVQSLIPRLHESGIRVLGIEFAVAHDQAEIDRLLAADDYDESLARRIVWNQWAWWGYGEYVDLFRAAWAVNHERPPGTLPFRIVGLNGRMDWSLLWSPEDREDPEIRAKAFPDGDGDERMAETILTEIVAKGEKALIYSGINHAYTRFRQPYWDAAAGEYRVLRRPRMGNRVYEEIGERCCTIFLHSPWPPADPSTWEYVYPADGLIDAMMIGLSAENRRAGFDVTGSPFVELPAETSLWSRGREGFSLADFCDGWIYQKPLHEYEGVSVVEGWFNESNRIAAIAQISNLNPAVKDTARTVQDLLEGLESTRTIREQFSRRYH